MTVDQHASSIQVDRPCIAVFVRHFHPLIVEVPRHMSQETQPRAVLCITCESEHFVLMKEELVICSFTMSPFTRVNCQPLAAYLSVRYVKLTLHAYIILLLSALFCHELPVVWLGTFHVCGMLLLATISDGFHTYCPLILFPILCKLARSSCSSLLIVTSPEQSVST